MTSRDFCYWLQGFFEIASEREGRDREPPVMSPSQIRIIERHLALVFKHEIDPSMGDAAHQADLNETHAPPKPPKPSGPIGGGEGPGGILYRC